jgi:hypothetical protein
LDLEADALVQTSKTLNQPAPLPEKSLPSDIQDALADSLEELNVEFLRCSADEVGEAFGKIVRRKKLKYILAWDDPDMAALVDAAEDLGVHVDYPLIPRDAERIPTLRKYAEADGIRGNCRYWHADHALGSRTITAHIAFTPVAYRILTQE